MVLLSSLGNQAAGPLTRMHGLEVRISLDQPTYSPGDEITLHVQFRNVGGESIRVGRELGTGLSAPFRLLVKIEDSGGRLVVEPVRDLPELPCLDLRDSGEHSFIWADLAPDQSYSTTLVLHSREIKSLRPGTYKIQGRYRSYGLLTSGHCINFNPHSSDETSNRHSRGNEWRGETNTNTLSLTILSSNTRR